MNTLRKCMSAALCLSVSVYTMPGFAFSNTDVNDDAVKVELSDLEMSQVVGAGSVDATLADYKKGGATAEAVFVNRAVMSVNYQLVVTDTSGNVLEVLQSGTLNPATGVVVHGTPTVANALRIQARIWNGGMPGLESKDSSWVVE